MERYDDDPFEHEYATYRVYPAGMSSDEDFYDDFDYDDYDYEVDDDVNFIGVLPPSMLSKQVPPVSKSLAESLPEDVEVGMRDLLVNSNKMSLFLDAVKASDFEKMRLLISQGVHINDYKMNQWTPLIEACCMGNREVVQFLLENKADPNFHKELTTPLMMCCKTNNAPEQNRLECIRLLLQHGAHVNATDKYRHTALMYAALHRMEAIVSELLNCPDINVNVTDQENSNALHHAVNGGSKTIVQKLLDAGINRTKVNSRMKCTPFDLAIYKGYKELVDVLKPPEEEEEHQRIDHTQADYYGSFFSSNELDDFLNELPDSKGQGGFSSDVRSIFVGVGLEELYRKLKPQVSFPDFLVMSDLSQIGVKYDPLRRKLLIEGIHRYHLYPWKKASLCELSPETVISTDMCINAVGNVMKHLVILYATIDYIKRRLPKHEKLGKTIDYEIVKLMVRSHEETMKLQKTILMLQKDMNKLRCGGDKEADFIGADACQESRLPSFWVVVGTASLAAAFFYYKFR